MSILSRPQNLGHVPARILFDATRPHPARRLFGLGLYPERLPIGPSEADWAEYCQWSREMEARRDIEDEDDREALEAAIGNRTPAESEGGAE